MTKLVIVIFHEFVEIVFAFYERFYVCMYVCMYWGREGEREGQRY